MEGLGPLTSLARVSLPRVFLDFVKRRNCSRGTGSPTPLEWLSFLPLVTAVLISSTPYKLTGWLASLDLAAPTQRLILSHRTASLHALYEGLVVDGGRDE